MDIRECYAQMNDDYDEVLRRFGSEAMVKKFAVKFLNDSSYKNLTAGLAEKNGEEAFRAAHTLKGISANLGFSNLYSVSAELTEKLRGRSTEGSEELFEKVREQYEITAAALRRLESESAAG